MSEATAKQRAAVWVAVVFLLGAALGGVVGYIFAHRAVSANLTGNGGATASAEGRRIDADGASDAGAATATRWNPFGIARTVQDAGR